MYHAYHGILTSLAIPKSDQKQAVNMSNEIEKKMLILKEKIDRNLNVYFFNFIDSK